MPVQVLVRVHDTRLFHKFGEPTVLVEYTTREVIRGIS
jgi:hypothetical protein